MASEFLVRFAEGAAWLRGASIEIEARDATHALRILGADDKARLRAEAFTGGCSNYLIGNDPSRWVRSVPHASTVRADDVLPGIDVRWRGNAGRLEYDFLLAPGVDPASIVLQTSAAVRLDGRGRLLQGAGATAIVHEAPVAWQEHEGERYPVDVAFAVLGNDRFGFVVGALDPALPLVIDPVLAYGTFLGGAGTDLVLDCAFDAIGNAVVSGLTSSLDFPTAGAPQGTMAGSTNAFAAKLSADGSTLLWSTVFGGSASDGCDGHSLALDEEGRVHLSGVTRSMDFPVTGNACQTTPGGDADGFIAVLSADGAHLDYATYLGGPGHDELRGIAVRTDPALGRLVYVTGTAEAGFPTTPGAWATTPAGSSDALLVCIAPDGGGPSDLRYSTLLGANNQDIGWAVAIDALGHAHVTGTTWHGFGGARFPTTPNAFHLGASASRKDVNCYAHFYARIAPFGQGGADLRYAVVLESENARTLSPGSLAIGGDGLVYLCGPTGDANYPTTASAWQRDHKGGLDGFLTVLDPDRWGNSGLIYSTLLGGSGSDGAHAVAVHAGRVYLVGESAESGGRRAVLFPTTNEALQRTNAGSWDAFVTAFDLSLPSSQQLVWSTLFGGSSVEGARCIDVSPSGSILIGGWTRSVDLPVAPAAFGTVHAGFDDGFVLRFDAGPQGGG